MSPLPHCVHFDLDGAWPPDATPPNTYIDVRAWGPRLRYCTSAREIEAFYESVRSNAAKFTLFGSGDFHHLSALWIRKLAEPFTLVSFDNHPDWDVRPPRWGCGTWINRALEHPALQRVAVWGCGNFELNWPGYLFASRRALREKRMAVWPWTKRLNVTGRRRWPGLTRQDWRGQFSDFARGLLTKNVYVTVDLDCLDEAEAVTNWEHGLFTAEDLQWAIVELAANGTIIGGDLCGAYSPQQYHTWTQRLAARVDHPAPACRRNSDANLRAFQTIWPALTGGNEHHADDD